MPIARPGVEAVRVVFTDLDGTLLDARTYSPAAARDALQRLASTRVPVVFCSSKTAAEQRPLREELGVLDAPFIVENGAAVLVPESSGLPVQDWPIAPDGASERVRVLGPAAADVRAGVMRAAEEAGVRVTGYADLTTVEVARLTGLDPAAAARACRRDYSETLVGQFAPDASARFASALAARGLVARHGGRFHTVTGADVNKGRAVRLVTELFATATGRPVISAGIGDSANDEDLLRAVDRPYLVTREDGTWAPLDVSRLRQIDQSGPLGWRLAVFDFLESR